MASLFPAAEGHCYLLDPGAGIGSLSAAFLERWRTGGFSFTHVERDAFEVDRSLHDYLRETLSKYSRDDFIAAATDLFSGGLFVDPLLKYSHIALNPPYKKSNSSSAYRLALRRAGLVYVTAFPSRSVMGRYLGEIAWETEVWVEDAPPHLIHFNGARFLGPHDSP